MDRDAARALVDAGRLIRTLNVSGGRSSGYMLYRLLQKNGGRLPDDHVAIFCNTGKEREETLQFVRNMEQNWDVPVVWLEYRYRTEKKGHAEGEWRRHYEIVDFESASRKGEPFEQLIFGRKLIPTSVTRLCTMELKVETIKRYMRRELGVKPESVVNVLGFRYDEPRRVRRFLNDPAVECPLHDDRVATGDVQAFWKAQNFDLGIPSWMGNCDLCFLKGRQNRIHTLRLDPTVGEWWSRMEKEVAVMHKERGMRRTDMARFNSRESVDQLLAESKHPELFESDFGVEDEPGFSCFCGDGA